MKWKSYDSVTGKSTVEEYAYSVLEGQTRSWFTRGPGTTGAHRPSCQRHPRVQNQGPNGQCLDLEDAKHSTRDRIILWLFMGMAWGMAVLSFWLLWAKIRGLQS